MPQFTKHDVPAAAPFERPLLLTPTQDLRGYLSGILGNAALFAITASSVIAVLLIFAFILRESIQFFTSSGGDAQTVGTAQSGQAMGHVWGCIREFFGSSNWYPQDAAAPQFGALGLMVGSLYVTLGALLLAVPLGLLAAVVLSDIVSFRLRQIIKPIIEILAAIPSVAYGFFAVMVVAPYLQNTLGLTTGANALNASLLLAVMAIPTIVSVSEDSLTALGRELREASYALGATRAETLIKVVMPAAHNGILAAIMLGMMRAIGETMVVWMAAGNATGMPTPWWDLRNSIGTMTATIAGAMGESSAGSNYRSSLFAIGLMLLAFTLVLNLLTEYLLHHIRRSGGRK